MWFIWSLFLCYGFLCNTVYADNQFISKVNPGCNDLCNNGTILVYSRLKRANDSLHVLFTVGDGLGELSLSYIQSAHPNQQLIIDWEKLLSDSPEERRSALHFKYSTNGSIIAKFGMTFTRLIEYDDTMDKVSPAETPAQNSSYIKMTPLSELNWQANVPKLKGDAYTISLIANSTNDASNASDIFLNGGHLTVSLKLSANQDRANQLPRLQFTGNNSQLELQLVNLKSSFSYSRFALESALLANDAANEVFDPIANIDDEYTPGIFHINNWYANNSVGNNICYAQWRPVCYKSPQRSIINSTVVHNSDLVALSSEQLIMLNNSFTYSLFGDAIDVRGAMAINVSFGQPQDKFYKHYNYTVWTLSLGIGEPPSDGVSALVVIIIACGLGVPVLLMLSAGLFICIRKLRGNGGGGDVIGYQPINA